VNFFQFPKLYIDYFHISPIAFLKSFTIFVIPSYNTNLIFILAGVQTAANDPEGFLNGLQIITGILFYIGVAENHTE
jgi:hypothetical protein